MVNLNFFKWFEYIVLQKKNKYANYAQIGGIDQNISFVS